MAVHSWKGCPWVVRLRRVAEGPESVRREISHPFGRFEEAWCLASEGAIRGEWLTRWAPAKLPGPGSPQFSEVGQAPRYPVGANFAGLQMATGRRF